MANGAARGAWARRITWAALILSIGGLAAALIAAVGSGQGFWHFRTGFMVLRYAFYAAVAGGVLALAGLAMSRRSGVKGLGARNLLALAIALAFITYLGMHIYTAKSVPAIHDVATNLDDVPKFRALRVRDDNLENIPDQGKPKLAAMKPEERWKALHRAGYPDLKTAHVPWTVEETIVKAQAVAVKKGWEIAHVDPARGSLEATDTSFFFRFKDDVVIRARKAPGGGTNVDMRSISRVGGSDIGVNAKRVREFLKDLRQS